MLKHLLILAVFALLGVIAVTADVQTASAQDADLPAVSQPGQWNYITQDNAASSSQCIGRPITPLCAVETMLACFQRGQFAMCQKVDDGAEQYAQVFSFPADPTRYLLYRVVAARRLTARDLPADQPVAKADDVILRIEQEENYMGQFARPATAPASDFVLRQGDDGSWHIVSWGSVE